MLEEILNSDVWDAKLPIWFYGINILLIALALLGADHCWKNRKNPKYNYVVGFFGFSLSALSGFVCFCLSAYFRYH